MFNAEKCENDYFCGAESSYWGTIFHFTELLLAGKQESYS